MEELQSSPATPALDEQMPLQLRYDFLNRSILIIATLYIPVKSKERKVFLSVRNETKCTLWSGNFQKLGTAIH